MQQITIFLVESRNWQWNSLLCCPKRKNQPIVENMSIYRSRPDDCFFVFCFFFFWRGGGHCKNAPFAEDVPKIVEFAWEDVEGKTNTAFVWKRLWWKNTPVCSATKLSWESGDDGISVPHGTNLDSSDFCRCLLLVALQRSAFPNRRREVKTIGDTSKNSINTLNNRISFCRVKLLLFLFKPRRRNVKQTQLFSRLTRIFQVARECSEREGKNTCLPGF